MNYDKFMKQVADEKVRKANKVYDKFKRPKVAVIEQTSKKMTRLAYHALWEYTEVYIEQYGVPLRT